MQLDQSRAKVEAWGPGFAALQVADGRLLAPARFGDFDLRHPRCIEVVDQLAPVHAPPSKQRNGVIVVQRLSVCQAGQTQDMARPRKEKERTPFGKRMLESREEAGLTQEDVRGRLGLAQSTLTGLESTATGSSYTVQLAHLYKKDPYWLATGEGEPDELVLSEDEKALVRAFRHTRTNVQTLVMPDRPGIVKTTRQKRRRPPKKGSQ